MADWTISYGPSDEYLAQARADQALVDSLPPELKAIVWRDGLDAIGDRTLLLRHLADSRRRERHRPGRRRGAYVAPVIGRF